MSEAGKRYELVPYEDRYRDDVLRLRNVFWGIAAEWNAEHFAWQQEQNPCFDGHLIYLAVRDGEVGGMRVLQQSEWEAGGPPRRFRAPCFTGTVVQPEHRNQGLFAGLTRFAESDLARRGYPCVLNLSAGPATYMSSLAAGWRAIGALQPLVRRPRVVGEGLRHRAARTLIRLAARARRGADGQAASPRLRCSEAAKLVAESPWDGRIRPVRSEAYLRWRFRDPSSRYTFFHLDRAGRLDGYVALQRRASPLSLGPCNVVDWVLRDPDDWPALMQGAIRHAEGLQQPLVIWSATLSAAQQRWLREAGFEDAARTGPLARSLPTVLVRMLGEAAGQDTWEVAGQRIDRASGWDLRMLCSDAF